MVAPRQNTGFLGKVNGLNFYTANYYDALVPVCVLTNLGNCGIHT